MNVGQGDCILITTPSGRLILVDAGSSRGLVANIRNSRDAVLTQLWGRRQRPRNGIEALVMTHHDRDHYNLMGIVLQGAPIRNLYYSGVIDFYSANPYRAWCNGVTWEQVRYESRVLENDPISVTVNEEFPNPYPLFSERTDNGQLFELQIIASNCRRPDSNWALNTIGAVAINTRSIVIRGTLAGRSFLLGADATEYTEGFLHDRYGGALRSDLVKVPHHGGGDSSIQEFVDDVNPAEAVFSCYVAGTKYKHPRKDIVDRWSEKVADGVKEHRIRYWDYGRNGLEIMSDDVTDAIWVTDDNGSFNYTFTQEGEFLRDEYKDDMDVD
ncbi:MAG: MBL fold metallo-hydrolase [Ramlibacter sp.]|nr:MBL fold metallo-hydrolase [Ramlibacter sp.]